MQKTKFILLGFEICFFVFSLQWIFYTQTSIQKEENIEKFFQEKKEYGISDTNSSNKENYVGIVEIPIIDVKVGFFSKENQLNSVEYGIEVIKNSEMPCEVGNLILASHSGTSSISYFKNIHRLKKGDYIYIYYKNIKHIYQVTLIYEEEKNGSISLPKVEQNSLLTLTTCKGDKQLILISEHVSFQMYE